MDEYNLLDFGPALNSTGGIMTILPPLVGPSYDILVPTTDRGDESVSPVAENALDQTDGNPIDRGDLGSRHAVLRPGADACKL